MCTADYAWKHEIEAQIQPEIGNITVKDMFPLFTVAFHRTS